MENVEKFYEDRMVEYFDDMTMYRNLYEYVRRVVSTEGKEKINLYLEINGFSKVILYGSGLMGRLLLDVLKENSKINEIKVYDKNRNSDFRINTFITLEEMIAEKDSCIIITPLSYGNEIKEELIALGINDAVFALDIFNCEKVKSIYENGLFV